MGCSFDIKILKPIIRYIDKEIKSSYSYITGSGDRDSIVTEYFDERGILIYNGFKCDYYQSKRSGFYIGTDVYLNRDGWFMEVKRNGKFDDETVGSKCYWTADWSPISAEEFVQNYSIDEVNQNIAIALSAGVESALEKQKKLQSRLDGVDRVIELLCPTPRLLRADFT